MTQYFKYASLCLYGKKYWDSFKLGFTQNNQPVIKKSNN
jgi:hypothetical protein